MARRRRVRGKKENAQRLHAGLRAGVRYGVTISPQENELLAKRIQTRDEVEFLERQSKRVTVWLVKHEGKEIPVVYDKQRKTIVTVLPPEYLADVMRARQRVKDEADE
jgi:hypothetical protein